MASRPVASRPVAARPAILAVDDEPAVLANVARDLRREYGAQYRILRAESGRQALDALRELKLRGEAVALFLVDQRMPEMTGVELLRQAMELYPDAKRVLLTAYADTEAAIQAINDVHLDHYLLKPWEPPEEHLYPTLTELLDDWQASFLPPFTGVRVIGSRWSAATHHTRDFLARNLVPYRALDAETDPEAALLLEAAGTDAARLPVVLLGDGTHLVQPTNAQLAEAVGLHTRAELELYDLVIVGGGPAGLAAAVYGASEGLKTAVVEGVAPGGQAGTSSRIENYLGFPSGVAGAELTRRAVTQASRFGAELLTPLEATGVRRQDQYRFVRLGDGSELGCRALLIATGVAYRMLDVPGAEALAGAGVYYGAATTEARQCQDGEVYVLGAGNSAGQAAMHLARYARRVTILVRGGSLAASMSHYLIAQLQATPNVEVRFWTTVERVSGGTGGLECVGLLDTQTGARGDEAAGALFVFIGAAPRTEWVADVVQRDPQGFILSGPAVLRDGGKPPRGWDVPRDPFWLETSVPGIFVAGDVRHGSVKRVASGVGEGAMAVQFIHQHLAAQ